MKIASWNVNSLKVRLPYVLDWLEQTNTDVLCLQETKLTDDKFPDLAIEEAGYEVAFSGQKTYNGVAILLKKNAASLRDVVTDVPGLVDPQRRIMAATIGDVRVIDLYVVNGKEVGSDKYDYKLHWLKKVGDYIEQQSQQYEKLIVLGDFNIAPEDEDVYDPIAWSEKILCSTPERDALKRIKDNGLKDCFRMLNQDSGEYSWWDFRTKGFENGRGLRIDLILASEALQKVLKGCWIDRQPRAGEKPSDHAPVVAEFTYTID
ncbi:exodeoxyribonuclease III [gamma proteobacterium HTCC5015]|nr:exodeoxyribonuclease III [gamma proteobacterium HTCC5015]